MKGHKNKGLMSENKEKNATKNSNNSYNQEKGSQSQNKTSYWQKNSQNDGMKQPKQTSGSKSGSYNTNYDRSEGNSKEFSNKNGSIERDKKYREDDEKCEDYCKPNKSCK